MIVYEPCNYVSNVAYYRSATRICSYPEWSLNEEYRRELKRGFYILSMGSAFWHGSHTYLGYQFDNTMIAMIAFTGYQGMVAPITNGNTYIRDISPVPRNHTGIQVSDGLANWMADQPAMKWGEYLANLDIEIDYTVTFGGLLSVIFGITLPWFACEWLISTLAGFLLAPDVASFIIEKFLPAMKEAKKDLHVSMGDKVKILRKFFGMIIKIGYAFLYQEIFVSVPFLYHNIPMQINSILMPHINHFASGISQFPQLDPNVNASKDVYPGDDTCRAYSPHAVWHEESAAGFLEIIFLSDFINGVLSKAVLERDQRRAAAQE